MAATRAIAALEAARIEFTVTEYDPDTSAGGYGDALVAATGLDPAHAAKTLVVLADDVAIVAVVPVAATLDLKALARIAGAKRAAMAPTETAERLSGSVVGAIAPLGHRKRLAVFIDSTLAVAEQVHMSGGRRGLEVSLRPDDLVGACRAMVAPIAR